MEVNSRLFWVCMALIVAAMVFVYTAQAVPTQLPEPRTDYTVIITWLDNTTTTVASDHVDLKNGWVAIHVTQDPVGMLLIPELSVSFISALENPIVEDGPKVLSVQK